MATPPDFTSGQILTAAQMNAVGLWLVKTDTITNAASKTVSDAFTTDFNAYRVFITHLTNGSAGLQFAMGATTSNTSGWYGAMPYWSGKSSGDAVLRANNAAICEIAFTSATLQGFVSFDVDNPFDAANTYISGSHISRQDFVGTFSYALANTTSYTSFTIKDSASNLQSGDIYVYGYNK
jgi:hypothetical protein